MIPFSDDTGGPRRRLPIVTYALILINVVVFVLEINGGQCFQADYSLVPAAIIHGAPAQFTGCPVPQPSPVYITILTAMFMHANILHIAGNMLYLFVFGDNVEDRFGHFWYLVFYLFCGVVASLAQIASDPNSTALNLGASGAIAGVLGAYLVFYPGARVRSVIFLGIFILLARLPAFLLIGFWFALQFLSGVVIQAGQVGSADNTAYFAHIGGFLAGLVIALLTRPFIRIPKYTQTYPYWARR